MQPHNTLSTVPLELFSTIVSLLSTTERSRSLAVCRKWRVLLTATAPLWQRLILDLHARPDTPLELLVNYSQALPLDLCITNIYVQHIPALLSALRANMHRIRVLKIWFGEFDNPEDELEEFTSALIWPAPVLEVFELGYTGAFQGSRPILLPVNIFARHAPKLEHITMDLVFWFTEYSDAFRRVTSFSAAPGEWDVDESVDMFPALEHLRFCGVWNPVPQAPGVDHLLPPDWRRLSSLSFAMREFGDDTDVADALAVVRAGCAHGVRNVALRVDAAHAEMLRAMQDLALAVTALRFTRGGHDFGVQFATSMAIGISVEITDVQGRIFSVGDSWDNRLTPGLEESAVASLLGALDVQSLSATLTDLALCASTFDTIRAHLASITLPHLKCLAVYVLPRAQRHSTSLFASRGPGVQSNTPADPGTGVFLTAPELCTLRLASHPPFPAWSVGWCIGEWRDEVVVEDVREVTAASVAEFIRGSIVFDCERLGEIVLDRDVLLSEGLHSKAVDDLRTLTDMLRYSE